MNSDLIFYMQIAQIVGYIVGIFFLYRLLVSQKDATIETLKQQSDMLEKRLLIAEANHPDQLVERLSKRVDAHNAELKRISVEEVQSTKKTQVLKSDLRMTRKVLNGLRDELKQANEVLKKTACPYCGAGIKDRQYNIEYADDGEIDDVEEDVIFDCGYVSSDGVESSPCRDESLEDMLKG